MKRLTLALSSLMIVTLCGTSVAAQRTTASSQVTRSPEMVIREFYKWYIHVNSHQIDPFKGKERATLKKYVTLRFIREIERNEKLPEGEGFDADYFLQTQEYPASPDVEADWIKSMSMSKVEVRGTTATAIVSFGDYHYPRVGVYLTREGNLWKINRVIEKRLIR